MKKIFIFILLINLFLISSCQDEKKYISTSKISCVEDIANSSFKIYLNIYTSKNINTLEIIKNKYIDSIILNYQTTTSYIFDQKEQPASLYQYLITFKKEIFSLSTLNVLVDNKEEKLDIGLYKIIKLDNDNPNILVTTDIVNDQLNIYIHNQMDRTIYITNITQIDNSVVKINVSKINPSDCYIYADVTKRINIVKINIPSNLGTVRGIIKLDFTTNLKQYSVYATYYQNKTMDVIKIV